MGVSLLFVIICSIIFLIYFFQVVSLVVATFGVLVVARYCSWELGYRRWYARGGHLFPRLAEDEKPTSC
jgi:hypothetical protein